MMKQFLFILLLTFSQLLAQTTPTAREFLNMPTDKAFAIIGKLNSTETASLISEIRKEVKKDYKKIDNFYFLISHMEEMKAVEIEQKRLKSLNLVYALGLALFMGFLGYIYLKQRRIIQQLNSFQK